MTRKKRPQRRDAERRGGGNQATIDARKRCGKWLHRERQAVKDRSNYQPAEGK